jgi:hypothetical protein
MQSSRHLEFRSEIIQELLRVLSQGGSCSLIGVGSSGKSNIARHIDRPDVREFHLGEVARQSLNLYVNCAKLTKTPYTACSLYCLILEVLAKAVKDSRPDLAARHEELRRLWKEAIESKSDALARSNLEEALDAAFQSGVKQAFITLDDLDAFLTHAPAQAVNSLRALRDDYKGKIMYLTITRRELEFLRDPAEVEDFLELVAPASTFAAEAYSETDARHMIEGLASHETSPRTLSDQEQERLLEISGRHPGLLRMLHRVVTQHQVALTGSHTLENLKGHPAIVEECEKIWASLENPEREDLKAVVSEGQPAGEGLNALTGKGVIQVKPDGTFAVFSPVFASFVEDHLAQRLPIQLLPEQQQIKVYGRIVGGLTDVEYFLLSSLVEQYPRPTTWGQLLEVMHDAEGGQTQHGGPPGKRLEAYLDDTNHKIDFGGQLTIHRLPDGRYVLRADSSR